MSAVSYDIISNQVINIEDLYLGFSRSTGEERKFVFENIESILRDGKYFERVQQEETVTPLVAVESPRIVKDFNKLEKPNSPNKTHYIVGISLDFLQKTGSREMDSLTDKVTEKLGYQSTYFSGLKDPKGIFAFVHKDDVQNIKKTAQHDPIWDDPNYELSKKQSVDGVPILNPKQGGRSR